ncbi:hypothetical protein O181_000459 [Austropuccinia psidii MF-1]|uniref:Uncharacterized protein n=1 Tax=Austropuccinia psidii MF-1 TaxID=1389203 RepID=A0A9Q3B8K4_9BASI|nr:hypothetical protein [Austropuccinia psidii MF-1]
MSIENLLNPITKQAYQDFILPMTSDEHLSFDISNKSITTEKQDQSEVDQDDDDDITKTEKIPLTLEEVTIDCSQIQYSLSSRPSSEKDPNWKYHLNA